MGKQVWNDPNNGQRPFLFVLISCRSGEKNDACERRGSHVLQTYRERGSGRG